MDDGETLPRLMLRNAQAHPKHPAIREKDRGIWRTYDWSQYSDHVRRFALGLAALGFERGQKLTVVGDNRPRLYWAQVAAQCLGGVSVPVYQDSIARELVYVLNHAEVSAIVAEDQEQVDKILSLRDQLPALKLLVYDDPRGIAQYEADGLLSFEQVQEAGDRFDAEHPGWFQAEIGKGASDDLCMIAYTSGTTGNPKGAMLTHRNVLSTAETFTRSEDVRRDDEWLCYLPMAWVGDSLYSLVLGMVVGFTCNCPESPETVRRDLRELGPTAVLAPPGIWENMLTSVQVRAGDATPLKRRVFEFFRAKAEEAELLRSDGKPVPAMLKLWLALGEVLVYGPVRDQLGLRRARWAYTGGAPLGPDAFRFFRSFGVNLKQVYGSTETSALVSVQPDAEANPNTVGRPCPGIEVRIAESGEVLLKSAGIFKGYFKAEDATREALDPDGWFHTGDAGFIDPRGHLVIIDRAKDVGKTATGSPFAPQFIENKLKFSPYIREAVSFGHERPFVAAMLAIDLSTAGNWAERRGLPYTSYTDLAQKPEMRALIREEIAKINATLPAETQIRRFLLLPKDLDADDAEMTRTRKLRRRYIAERYRAVIDAFYSGAAKAEIENEVTFEDGRTAALRHTVVVEDVTPAPAVARAA
jgi:long-chain acyl-CoA synthetase